MKRITNAMRATDQTRLMLVFCLQVDWAFYGKLATHLNAQSLQSICADRLAPDPTQSRWPRQQAYRPSRETNQRENVTARRFVLRRQSSVEGVCSFGGHEICCVSKTKVNNKSLSAIDR